MRHFNHTTFAVSRQGPRLVRQETRTHYAWARPADDSPEASRAEPPVSPPSHSPPGWQVSSGIVGSAATVTQPSSASVAVFRLPSSGAWSSPARTRRVDDSIPHDALPALPLPSLPQATPRISDHGPRRPHPPPCHPPFHIHIHWPQAHIMCFPRLWHAVAIK
jgi:hypothetical protein